MIAINFVTPKAAAKHELLFNEPALDVVEFVVFISVNLVTLSCAA
jgi:hypothetical protein